MPISHWETSTTRPAGDAVAIVGVGLRLPAGVSSLDQLWAVLVEGRDLVTEVPADRFDGSRFLDSSGKRPGKAYTVAGGFLDDVGGFDADYFGVSPKEVSRIDPQQRLLLECAVEAFDDAGIDPARQRGRNTAVFMGISTFDYNALQSRRPKTYSAYTMSGTASCNAANRISHFFDLNGQSAAVDTACSSALTAVHNACETLRWGRSELALAGGVNVVLSPHGYLGASQASMLSPTGRCHAFSARADGFVRAEGAGVFLLKPLAAALADGDRVHAVIAGTGANSDGHTAGLSLPSTAAQSRLLEQVYGTFGVDPGAVDYVEAHGTGTQAGDPVECAALGSVLGRARNGSPLPIGSVKSNVGHLEAGAGAAGLCKAILVLRERWIPRTLHSEPLNPDIDFAGLGLAPAVEARPVEAPGRCVVGVNSFGFGGANAHAILIEPGPLSEPARAEQDHGPRPGQARPVLVSARTPQALAAAATGMAGHLVHPEADDLRDVAFTSCRRGRHRERCAVLAADAAETAQRLHALAQGDPVEGAASARAVERGRIGFVFSGNGSTWPGMAASLLATDTGFAEEVAAIDFLLTPALGWSVRDELAHVGDPARWERTEVAQPLLFTVQAGLVATLAARGVVPAGVAGHSVGEVAAAYCAGLLDRENACRVIVERSQAQAATFGAGRMAAVGLSAEETVARLRAAGYADRLVITAVNTDRDVTVAGDADTLAAWGAELQDQGVFFRDLRLDYAFHTSAMDPLREPLAEGLRELKSNGGDVPFFSTVTAALETGPLGPGYWWRNVREPVRFATAVTDMTTGEQGVDVLVEIGPHPVLSTYLRRITDAHANACAVVPTLTRTNATLGALDTTLAQLLAVGADVDWRVFFPDGGRIVSLPAYPWERETHWNGRPDWWLDGGVEDTEPRGEHPLLGTRQPAAEPTWQQHIEPARLRWLADHKVAEAVVMPAAGFVDMALSAGHQLWESPVEITGLVISTPLTLPFDDPSADVLVHTHVVPRDGGFTISSRLEGQQDWTDHVRGRVRRLLRPQPPKLDLDALGARLTGRITADDHYDRCNRVRLHYGPAFRALRELRVGDGECLAFFRADPAPEAGHQAHPSMLDVALQAGISLVADTPYLPSSIGSVRCWQPIPPAGTVHVSRVAIQGTQMIWDITVTDADRAVVLELLDVHLRRFEGARAPVVPRLEEVLRAAPVHQAQPEPVPLPTPRAVLSAAAEELSVLTEQWHTHRWDQFQRRALHLNAHFTAAAIRELLPGHATFTLADLSEAVSEAAGVRLLPVLLEQAESHGVLTTTEPDTWRYVVKPDPSSLFDSMVRDFPSQSALLQPYGTCGRHLAAVLSGKEDPLELLFSETDALAVRFYDGPPLLTYHYRIARQLLRTAIAEWPHDRPLRILEVGAGTGATTVMILPELPPEQTHYTYTDVSPGFFAAAKERLRQYDFVDYRRLDLDADPADQGFPPSSFDLVIASNVLHATRDLASTMSRIADLLADNGHVVAVEMTNLAVMVMPFGTLDSFWTATDDKHRPDGPLLTREGWTSVLDSCQFRDIVHVGDPEEPARSDCTVIFAARAPRTGRAVQDTPPGQSEGEPSHVPDPSRTRLVADLTGQCGDLTAVRAERLGEHGETATCVLPAPDDSHAWRTALADLAGPADIIAVLGDQRPTPTPEETTRRALHHYTGLRELARVCEHAPEDVELTVWLVLPTAEAPPASLPPRQGPVAAVWGAARTLAEEQPRLHLRRVALTWPDNRSLDVAVAADTLLAELTADTEEDEVLLTTAGRFVPRLRMARQRHRTIADGSRDPFTLEATRIGQRYALDWRPATIPTPGPGEVTIKVAAAALNYRDVMTVMGLVPPGSGNQDPTREAVLPGLECAGTVVAAGPDVSDHTVGDRVFAPAWRSLGSHTLARADRTLPIPDGMTFAEAATFPIVFLTVEHGLRHLARLEPGETLLVHGAAGGVGLGALQYARNIGARVIATAGTPAKRDFLHLCGVDHVLDSRSLHFAEQVMDLTGGQGVDVVLNSLAGEALRRSLELLRPHGRFVELGKRDILTDNPLSLAPFDADLAFFGMDISSLIAQTSPLMDRHCATMRQAVHDGLYRPLPHRAYPADHVREAFEHLQYSRHTGKVVVTFDDPVPVAPAAAPVRLRPDATYLITGGLGGFGAATARHLVDRGARHLALVGRRGPGSPEAPALLADLRDRGAAVHAFAADAADRSAMRDVLDAVEQESPPLAGVIHGAMVLDDAPMIETSDERLQAVLAPKMTAGWVLDELTRGHALDFFVLFSSAVVTLGNLQQTAYVAGNSALDALARQRRRAGLPALSLQWGPVTDAGYVERAELSGHLEALGFGRITVTDAMAAFDELVADPTAEVVSVVNPDWERATAYLPGLTHPRAAGLIPEQLGRQTDPTARQALADLPEDEAVSYIEHDLTELMARVMQTSPDRVDRHRPLEAIGVDSLMATELTVLIRQHFDCEISTMMLTSAPSLAALAQRIHKQSTAPGSD